MNTSRRSGWIAMVLGNHGGKIRDPILAPGPSGKQNTKKIRSQWIFADPTPCTALPLHSLDILM
jgi:hypothetical protein